MPDDVLTDEDVGLETETETPLLTDEEVGFKSPEQIQQPKPFTTLGTTEPYFGAYIQPPEQRRAEFVEGMFKPAVPLPRAPDVIKAPAGPVEVVLGNVMTPGGTIRNLLLGDQPGAEVNRRILNFAVSLPEFFETPAGVLTAGLGALGKGAQTVLSGVFSIDLLKNALKQSTDLVKNWRTMTPEQRAGAVVDILGTTTLGGGAGVHAATGIARMRPRAEPEAPLPLEPPPIPPPPIPTEPTAPVPAAPTALPETAAGERALAQQIDAAAEVQAAAKPKPAKLNPNDLEPALLIDGKPVSTGGIDHDAVKNALLDAAKSEEEKVKILEAFIEDENHVFVDKEGNHYSRKEASDRLDEEKPLQSSRLAELKEFTTLQNRLGEIIPQINRLKDRWLSPEERAQLDRLLAERETLEAQIEGKTPKPEAAPFPPPTGAPAPTQSNADFVASLTAYTPAEKANILQTLENNAGSPSLPAWKKGWLEANQKRLAARQPAAPAPSPAAPVPAAAPAGPEPLFGGQPLSYWIANASKGEVPKGEERAKLAKYLAVPNKPTDILNRLKDPARIARIHAPEPKPEELAGMPPTEPPPVPPAPTPTRVSKPHIITREMEQALADLGYTKKQRNALTPEQAQDIIAKQEKAPAVTPVPKPVTPVTPKPPAPVVATPEQIEQALNIPVPDVAEARARVRAIDNTQAELREQIKKLQAERQPISQRIRTTRGARYGSTRIKASASKADIAKERELDDQIRDLDNRLRALDDAAKTDRRSIDESIDAKIISDTSQPLARRLDRLVRKLGEQAPQPLVESLKAEIGKIIKAKYPDITPEEIGRLYPEVNREIYFGGDPWKSRTVPNLYQLRRAALDAAINAPDVPYHAFPDEIKARIDRFRTVGRAEGVEDISAAQLAETKELIRTTSEQIRAELAAKEKAAAEEKAADAAKAEQMMQEAQAIADSAKRPGTKGGRSPAEVRDDLVAKIKQGIDKLIEDTKTTITRREGNDITAANEDNAAFGTIEKTDKGFTVSAKAVNGERQTFNVKTVEEAEWLVKALAAEKHGTTIVIGIPGDGVFRLNRVGSNLVRVWRDAKNLDVFATRKTPYKVFAKAEPPPAKIGNSKEWQTAKDYHGLNPTDKIYDWSPALRSLAELVNREKPESVTAADVDAFFEKAKMGPGAAAAAEFDEARPSAAAMGLNAGNPLLNRIQVRADNFIRGIKQLFARSPIKQDISQLANAADNIPRVAGQIGGNSIRLRATEAERHAITYLMGALKMSGEGLSVEDAARLGDLEFAGDPIGYLRTKQADMETAAQVFLNQGKRLEAQAAIDAAKHLALAREKYNQLLPIARRVRNQFDSQIQREHRWGINTEYQNWYTPGRYELDLMTGSNRPIIFGEHRGSGVTTTFKKAKVFEDYPEAIEKGFVPRSTDIANLLEHRIVQGERLIQRKSLYNQLRAVRDPIDQNPLVIDIPKRRITRPDGTTDVQESVPRGYTPHEVIPGVRVAVHDGYSPLMKALTATSTQISESAIVGTLQDIAAIEKHIGLALDTFHASRVLQTELMLTGKISVGAHLKRGLALVEYRPEDLNLAVEKGLITQDMANWVRTARPIEVNGRTVRLSPHMIFSLGAKNGLNMARVSDVLYRDWLRQIPITGTVNKWVFDKATRSAMSQAYLMEFERVAKNNPHLSATRVARVAASDINLMFGNLQKESIFKNPSVTAINQILFLAPRWVESLVRKELRFGRQLGQAGRDIVRGRPVGAPIPIEGRTGTGTYQRMTHLPQMGTVAKGMGTGIAAYFVATQLLNLYTRGHFTFENPEEGHKLDAWIPDVTGKTKGFFISPLSVFGEISHDIIRLSEARPDFASVLQQIAQNKLGNFGRFLQVVAAGRDPMTNEKLIGTANRAMKAGIQLIPVPISLSQVSRAAAAEVAPTLVSPPAPGSTQRQISASLGFKTEPASTAQNQVFRFADAWKKSSSNKTLKAQVERRLKEDFGPSEYKDLRTALIRKDLDAARRAYNVLLESKDPRVIRQTMGHPHPFTGSLHNERAFIFSLNPEQRKVYREAVNERRQMYTDFLRMLRETHR